MRRFVLIICLGMAISSLIVACSIFSTNNSKNNSALDVQTSKKESQKISFKLGIEVFLEKYASRYKGLRLGLVTNPTGVDSQLRASVDLIKQKQGLNLVALFAPEHGIRGNVRAGENVAGGFDPVTRLPVYTLYGGKDHKPTPESLQKIDVLIFDIQDVGSRAYTYIWHMAECMKACAEQNKKFVVLDRPNIYGGIPVDGAIIQAKYRSFIGLYPVPRVYGMTIGELALYLNKEERMGCSLEVIPMSGYKRGMIWDDLRMPWVPSSPNIPDVQAALCFAATGALGEIGCVSIGIGYTLPFQVVGSTWMNAERSSQLLNQMKLPGIYFRPIYFKPISGGWKDVSLQGVQLHVTDPSQFLAGTTELAIIWHLQTYYPQNFKWNPKNYAIFDKAVGSDRIRLLLQQRKSWQTIIADWQQELNGFKQKRERYLIYR